MMRPQPKPVIVISSHVARGSVGNRAAVFSLEVLGHPVWAIPTLILPFHPGHGKGTRIVPENNQFADLLKDLADSPWITEVGGILTGYMANAEQAIIVAAFIRNIREKNPALLHICDPVMGDQSLLEPTKQGRLYIGEETAMAIKHHLCDGADMLTPNRFELSWLVGKPINSTSDAIGAAGYFPNKRLLVTSMPGFMKGNIGNLLIDDGKAHFAEHKMLDNPPNGPGDLTSALILSHLLSGADPLKALQLTTSSVFEIVAGAAKRQANELMLETDAQSISRPMSMVQMRTIALVDSSASTAKRPAVFKPTSL